MMPTSRSELPERIDDILQHGVDEGRLHGLWVGMQHRRQTRRRRGSAVAVVLLTVLSQLITPTSPPPALRFLRLADGSLPLSCAVDPEAPTRVLVFEEGSSVRLSAGSRWVALRNDADVFETEIDRGRVEFQVTPGLNRRWRVRLGAVLVEVVGTEFVLEKTAERLRVAVQRGTVRVSGAPVGAVRLLHRGDEIAIEQAPRVSPDAQEPQRVAAVTRDSEPATGDARPERARVASTPPLTDRSRSAWRAMAQRGDHEAAYELLGSRGIRAEAMNAEAERLALLADVARLSGHPQDAVEPLERLLSNYPRSAQAPIAAVVLGRLAMDQLRRPELARSAFQRGLALGIPAALQDDVRMRLQQIGEASPSTARTPTP